MAESLKLKHSRYVDTIDNDFYGEDWRAGKFIFGFSHFTADWHKKADVTLMLWRVVVSAEWQFATEYETPGVKIRWSWLSRGSLSFKWHWGQSTGH